MGRPAKSQWDFGELFPVEPSRKVLSVSELTSDIRRLLEKHVGQVWVTGEITNFRSQNSGHIYFTVKDAAAQLSCVLFRGEIQVDRSFLQDGRKVILRGEITVYEPRGQYQLRVTSVELQGVGALQAAFEKLKQKLNAEGLFAQQRKRPLPRYPQRIGLATSPSGAALRDVLHVVQRRNPALEIVLAPCRVQGDGAAAEIAAAIRLLNEFNLRQRQLSLHTSGKPNGRAGDNAAPGAVAGVPVFRSLDLILVTRGGGSLEDLWAFNEEIVARAIFESSLPVVSAVGHEIDFTISDFVADVRAATPSAGAEIITEGVVSVCQFLSEARSRLAQLAREHLSEKSNTLVRTSERLARLHPRRRLNSWFQRLDDLQSSLGRAASQDARRHWQTLRNLSERLARVRPTVLLEQRLGVLRQTRRRLNERARQQLREVKARVAGLEANLRLLGPQQVLERGYSITTDVQTGVVLRNATTVKPGQEVKTRLASGEFRSRAE